MGTPRKDADNNGGDRRDNAGDGLNNRAHWLGVHDDSWLRAVGT